MAIYLIFILLSTHGQIDLNTISGIINDCTNGGWVKVYQQSSSSPWNASAKDWCTSSQCSWFTDTTDYLDFDLISLYEGNGYAFLMTWDNAYWIQWKQKDNPKTLSADSTPDPLSGDYESTLDWSDNLDRTGYVNFYGLTLSPELGVIFDGRGPEGTWFVVGITDSTNLEISFGIPGWVTIDSDGEEWSHWGEQVQLYVWNPICGNWGGFPTESPTTHFPTKSPSQGPTLRPTTPFPTETPSPTESPSVAPTENPTAIPTTIPTISPTPSPTVSPTDTITPSSSPTHALSELPTRYPSINATDAPIISPSCNPTILPTQKPTNIALGIAARPSNLVWVLTGFSVSVVSLLSCFFMLCMKSRKARTYTVKKAITEMTRRPVQCSLTDSQSKNYDIYKKTGTNELHGNNLDLNDISNYNSSPLLYHPTHTFHNMQTNSSPLLAGRAPFQNSLTHQNSLPQILYSPRQTVDPITGQVVWRMMRQNPPMAGIPGQFRVRTPRLGSLEPRQTGGYEIQVADIEGGTNEKFTEGLHDSKSSQRISWHESPGGRTQKKFMYLEDSQSRLEPIERRSTRKKKKKRKSKQRKKKKRNSKKSLSKVEVLSSSDDEIVQAVTPNGSLLLFNWIPTGSGVSEADGEMHYSSRDGQVSTRTVSPRSTSASVMKIKQSPWSEEEIVRMVKKQLEAENQQLSTSVRQASYDPSPGLTISSNKILSSGESASESMTKSRDIDKTRGSASTMSSTRKWAKKRKTRRSRQINEEDERGRVQDEKKAQKRRLTVPDELGRAGEDNGRDVVKATVEKSRVKNSSVRSTLSPESACTSCYSDDSKASVSWDANRDSQFMAKMKEEGIDLSEVGMKIPKNFEELKLWQNSMLDTVAEKYFDNEFLDSGGVVHADMLGTEWPSKRDIQGQVQSSQSADEYSSGDEFSPESMERPAKDH